MQNPSSNPNLDDLAKHIENYIKANPEKFQGGVDPTKVPGVKPVPQAMVFRCAFCEKPVLSGSDNCTYCGKPTEQTFKGGDMVNGRYLIEDLLVKRGGFGTIYAVIDTQTQKRLVMKQLQHKRQVNAKNRELFKREGEILSALKHPGIPAYHDAFELDGALYLVIERIDGLTVSTLLHDKGKFSEADALDFCSQALAILEYLGDHTPPIIHRDIKPANFMRSMDGRYTLLDFGNATQWRTRKVDEKVDMGPQREFTAIWTKGFAAPEVLMGMVSYPSSDLFGLAASMLNLLSNAHPLGLYEGRTGTFVFPENTCSPKLQAILSKMLALKVEDRFRNASEVREALRAAKLIS
ncbi:Serine/threonine-protein kinase F [compost metagenome]